MRRGLILILVAAVALSGAFAANNYAQFTDFKNAAFVFADSLAGSLALNSVIGSTWSDSFIGSFPHFGAGIAMGASFTGKNATEKMFADINPANPAVPSGLDTFGIPVPAVAATLKLGFPFLPFDLGLKAGYVPSSLSSSLKSLYNVDFDYKLVGLEARYGLVKESLWTPKVSIGVGVNYLNGDLSAPFGSDFTIQYGATQYKFSQPQFTFNFESTTIDFDLQASKQILFILTPYLGAGLTMGSSTVKAGVSTTTNAPLSDPVIIQYLQSLGFDASATNFAYSTTVSTPTFRVYGGFSLNILLVLDFQLMYVPATKSFGGSVIGRVQF